MRTSSFLLAAAALTLAFSGSASAQDVPLHVTQPAPHYVSNTSAQPALLRLRNPRKALRAITWWSWIRRQCRSVRWRAWLARKRPATQNP